MTTEYSNVSNGTLAAMLEGELKLHMLNDPAAREKILEAVIRLKESGNKATSIDETKIIKKRLATAEAKLSKVKTIVNR